MQDHLREGLSVTFVSNWSVRRSVVPTILLAAAFTSTACGQEESPAAAAPAPPTADDAAVNDARYNCLLDKGFAVTRGDDGGVRFQDPDDTRTAAYADATRECDQQLAAAGLIVQDSSDSLRTEYRAMSAAHECLVDAGFPLVDWPSEDVFVQDSGSFNLLEATSPIDPDEARAACPDEFEALDDL